MADNCVNCRFWKRGYRANTAGTPWIADLTGPFAAWGELSAEQAAALSSSEDHARRVAPLSTFIQSDPRGAALYIIRPGDIPEGSTVDSCYTRGICVY